MLTVQTGAFRWSMLDASSAPANVYKGSPNDLLARTCAALNSARPGDLSPSFTLELATQCTAFTATTQDFVGFFRPMELCPALTGTKDVAVALDFACRVNDEHEVSGFGLSETCRAYMYPKERLKPLRAILNKDPRRTHVYQVFFLLATPYMILTLSQDLHSRRKDVAVLSQSFALCRICPFRFHEGTVLATLQHLRLMPSSAGYTEVSCRPPVLHLLLEGKDGIRPVCALSAGYRFPSAEGLLGVRRRRCGEWHSALQDASHSLGIP
jgi:hypothetical protein